MGIIQFTVRGLALLGALGVSTFFVAVGLFGDWSGDALVFAAAVGALAAVAPVILFRFGTALGPIRRLPEVRAAELKATAGALGTKLKEGERRFVDTRGFGRVVSLGAALWDLRGDLQALKDGGLAPASALVETMMPTRLIRVGISALAAPVLLAVGSMSLLFAVVLA